MRKLAALLPIAFSISLHAQAQAPVPVQLTTAHTVFVAPAGGFVLPNNEDYVTSVYSSTYKMLQSLGPFQMAAKPTDADLAIEVSLVGIGATPGIAFAYLKLVIIDPKTRNILWAIESPILADEPKDLDAAEARAADDLKSLISSSLPVSPATKKKKSH